MATARPDTVHPDMKEAGRMSEVAIALHDGAQGRGIGNIITARLEGNEARTNRQGEIEADLMSVDIGAIDILLHQILRDEASHINIHRQHILKRPATRVSYALKRPSSIL